MNATSLVPIGLFLGKATLVLVAARGITRVLGRAPAGARHLVWLVTLGALLFVVPALAAWAPLRLAVSPAALPAAVFGAPTSRGVAPHVTAPVERPVETPVGPNATGVVGHPADASGAVDVAPHTGWRGVDVVWATLALWAAVMLAVGGSLVRSWSAVRRIVRRARSLDTPDWRAPLWEVADRLGLEEPPRLLQSDDATMPFACGLTRPTIVLPAASEGWTPDRRRAVLLHELAHVRRRDLVGHTLARVVCAVYWFHPLVWTAAKRLRAESERACDDLALTCGARAADYAEHLLEIVTAVRRDATPVVALAMARRTEFEGRMLDILDAERSRAAPTRRQLAPLVVTLALLTAVVGAAAPAPAAPAAPAAHAPAPRVRDMHAMRDTIADPPGRTVPSGLTRAEPPQVREPVAPVGFGVAQPAPRAPTAVGVAAAPPARVVAPPADPPVLLETVRANPSPAAALPPAVDAIRALAPRGRARDRGALDDGRAALLAKVLRTDTSASLRRIAAWGLAEHANVPAAVAALAAAVRGDRDATVREMAAWALADADRDAAARDVLTTALRGDADARVRETAAWTLGTTGDRGAADALVAALVDASPQVRTLSVWALGTIEPREAPRALVAMLGDRDAKVRRLTAWALFTIEDPAAVPALQAAFRTESDIDLRIAYIRALAALGEQSVDALRALLDSPDPRIKAVAVRALAGGNAAGVWPWPWPRPRPFP